MPAHIKRNKKMNDTYKIIRTNRGEPILVSNECYEQLNKHTWHVNNVGIVMRARKKSDPPHYPKNQVSMAREILGFFPPHHRIWFVNRNTLDHRLENMIAVPAWLHLQWTREYEQAVSEGNADNFEPTPWKEAIKQSNI